MEIIMYPHAELVLWSLYAMGCFAVLYCMAVYAVALKVQGDKNFVDPRLKAAEQENTKVLWRIAKVLLLLSVLSFLVAAYGLVMDLVVA